jgi:hypothetical protein
MSKYVMPCIGDYSEDDYACVYGCSCPEECLMLTIETMPVAKLTKFLSHPNANVRQLAKLTLERAMDSHFTKPPPKVKGTTEIVKGAPVKITRGQVGSHGKSVKEELVDMPDANWAEPEELEVPASAQPSDFSKWAAPIVEQIERIDKTDSVGELSEGLADEHDIVRDKAEEKLRRLQKDTSANENTFRGYKVTAWIMDEASSVKIAKKDTDQKEKSRFDIIDLDDLEDN